MDQREQSDRERLARALPDAPASFDYAVRQTLEGIVNEKPRGARRLRVLLAGMAAMLCLAGAAMALSGKINLFNFFSDYFTPEYQAVQPEAYDLTRRDVAFYAFPHVDVAIREAAWDGRVLRVLYSVRDRAAAAPYTDAQIDAYQENEDGTYAGFQMPAADLDGVGAYKGCDYLFINGQSLSMTGYMGARAGEENGEVLVAIECDIPERIESEGAQIALGERFTVSLPIAHAVDASGQPARDAEGRIVNTTPEELAFTMDNGALPGVQQVLLPAPLRFADGELRVTDFTISPIRVYVTARFTFDADASMERVREVFDSAAFAALTDENGDNALTVFDWGCGTLDVDYHFEEGANGAWREYYTPVAGKRPVVEVTLTFVPRARYPEAFRFTFCEGVEVLIPNRRAQ